VCAKASTLKKLCYSSVTVANNGSSGLAARLIKALMNRAVFSGLSRFFVARHGTFQ